MADNYSFKDAGGNTVTHASEEISTGVHASKHVPVDDAGVAIAKAEDAAHSSGDKGYMLLAVRKDSAALAGADGDYIPLIVDSQGRLHVTPQISAGDVAHDTADSGNPVKIGGYGKTAAPGQASADGDRVNAWFDRYGRLVIDSDTIRAVLPASLGIKASSASLAVTLASDQTAEDNGTPAARTIGLGATYQDLTNTPSSDVTADNAGWLRMTQQRELLVSARARWAYAAYDDVDEAADLTGSTTNAYGSFSALTTAFLNGSDVGFGAAARWIRIPMLEQFRGCTIGIYHNLGVALTVALLADITGRNSSASVQRPQIDTVSVASGAFAWFSPFPLAEGANASMRYVPMLNMPTKYITMALTPASDPASGGVYVAVAR